MRLLFLAILLLMQPAYAVSENVRRWIRYETTVNAVASRSPEPVNLEHFEIPLSYLEMRTSSFSDKQAIASLVFKKNGADHVRWIINPEDSRYHLTLQKQLIQDGLDGTRYRYFRGYRSASRSYFIEDPVTGYEFFAKVSTNNTGGKWTDKKQDWNDAKEVKLVADVIHEAVKAYPPRHLKIMNEALVFGIESVEQGMVIRSMAELRNNSHFYLPGFSVLHEELGRKIAARNGSKDPQAYWNEHYNKPLARAMAEYNIMTGIAYDSPHSQNFLVEFDSLMRPTGKIVFRDFADAFVIVEYRNALGGNLTKVWSPGLQRSGHLTALIGVLHGNVKPTWITEEIYDHWGKDYHESYEREMSRLTGIPIEALQGTVFGQERSGDYFRRKYALSSPWWMAFLEKLRSSGGYRGPDMKLRCRSVFRLKGG